MHKFLLFSCLLLPVVAHAEEKPITPVPVSTSQALIAPAKATVTVWTNGLRAPQGMTRDAAGNLYVAEFNGGQVSKFAPDGKLLGKLGDDLKSPAWIERVGNEIYVSERKANRVLKLQADGTLQPLNGEVIEPLGLAASPNGDLLVIAHTTSRLLRYKNLNTAGEKSTPQAVYAALSEVGNRYGYRAVAIDNDGIIYITDEIENAVLLLTPQGRMAVWAKDLDDPTAVVFSPDGTVYVAEEGAGRVSRLNAEGVATVVAEGLGQPRDIEFLDDKTMLVSDRQSGTIWKVELPA